jgi:hypothetical protein
VLNILHKEKKEKKSPFKKTRLMLAVKKTNDQNMALCVYQLIKAALRMVWGGDGEEGM